MSLTFANPAAFWLLLVLPLLAVLKALGDARAKRAAARLVAPRLHEGLLVIEGRARSWVVLGFELLALALFIAALARPQYGVITEDAPASGRSLIIAIDTSRSMDANDVQPSRLERAKFAAEDLVKKLRTDRIGLLPFAGDASFLYAPITADTDAVLESIQAMDTAIVARGGSNLAKSIDRAVDTFKQSDLSGQQAVILFSDGEELEGEALAAARRARDAQVAIVCVAVGTVAGGLIPDESSPGGFFRDRDNKIVQTKLQREVLMKIADITNGIYLTLDGPGINDARLDVILNKLNRSSMKKRTLETAVDRFRWPLTAGLASLVAAFLAGIARRYRTPGAVAPAAALLTAAGVLVLQPRPLMAQEELLPPPAEAPVPAASEVKPPVPETKAPEPPKEGDPWQFYKEGDWRNSVFNFGIAAGKARRDEDIDRLQMARGVAAFKAATQDEQKFDAGMMEQAIDAFGVALASDDLAVRESAHYNLANAIFERAKARERERVTAEAQAKSKKAKKKHEITLKYLDSVIRQLENSLEHYEEVLTYNKDHEPARKNLEAVADLVKKLRDIRKQKAQEAEGQGQGEGEGQGQGQGKGKGKGKGQGQGQGEGEGEEGEEGEGDGEGEDEGGGEGDREGKGKGDKEGEGKGKGEQGKEGEGGGADESNKEFEGKAGADGDADGDGESGDEESSEEGGGDSDGSGGNKAGGGLDDTIRNLKNLSQELKSRPRTGPSQERRPAKDW